MKPFPKLLIAVARQIDVLRNDSMRLLLISTELMRSSDNIV